MLEKGKNKKKMHHDSHDATRIIISQKQNKKHKIFQATNRPPSMLTIA